MGILNDNFLKYGEVFGPGNASIDESMIPYFGRHPAKQSIRGKPVRWGYKAWVAADPNGYAFLFTKAKMVIQINLIHLMFLVEKLLLMF